MESGLLTRASDRLQKRPGDMGAFYDSLSKQQIRELKVLIESTEFRFDIVASLPIELIPLVFQQLELYQLFQCRRVSRRWRELLGAEEVVKPMLQPWIATEEIKLRIPEGLSSKSVLNIYAEHQDAFQTGNAFGRFKRQHGLSSYRPNFFRFRYAYSDGMLAWLSLTGGSHVICLRDLESGDERTFMPPERDDIDEVVLSQTLLVAMTTSARCYIWAHQTPRPPFVLRIPSHCQNVFHLSKASFILIHVQLSPSEALAHQSISVITWKLRDCWRLQPPEQPPRAIVSQFSIRTLLSSSVMARYDVYIDRQEQHIVFLESTVVNEKCTHTFKVLHFSFEGKTLFEESLDYPFARSLNCPTFARSVSLKAHENHPLQKERFFDIWVMTYGLAYHDPQNNKQMDLQETSITYLQYYLDRKVIRVLDRKQLPHSHRVAPGSRLEILPWKGIVYLEEARGHFADGLQYHLKVMNFREETCVEARYAAQQGSDGSISLDRAWQFFGDEVFIVKITSTDLIVWCFDKHLRMAGEDEEFKEERRLLQRRRLTNSTQRRCEF